MKKTTGRKHNFPEARNEDRLGTNNDKTERHSCNNKHTNKDAFVLCSVKGFTALSTQLDHVERGQFI